MNLLNEYSQIKEVAIRSPLAGFVNNDKISREWEALRYHAKPDMLLAISEYKYLEPI